MSIYTCGAVTSLWLGVKTADRYGRDEDRKLDGRQTRGRQASKSGAYRQAGGQGSHVRGKRMGMGNQQAGFVLF